MSICFQGSKRRFQHLNAGMKSKTGESISVHAVAVANEIFRLFPPGSGFPQLLSRPFVGGGIGDGNMDDAASFEFHNDKDVDRPEQPVVYGREIARPNITGMNPDESGPIVVRGRDLSYSMDVYF
jgi:hypothetical protein